MGEQDHILTAEGIHKSFGTGPAKVEVLRGLDLSVRRGEFLAVMGPSGCGKSTLLHVLGLMTPPQAGRLLVDGCDVTGYSAARQAKVRREKIGFVFQRFNLISVLSGYDNIALSLKIRRCGNNGRIEELLDTMGVIDVARRKPAQLSIGEQQRLAVARAVAHRPQVLLADEPTGSLDSTNKAALLGLLRQTNEQYAQTIVMITHSASAAEAAGRVVHMEDGRILDQNC